MNSATDWRKNAHSVKDKLKYTLKTENTQQDVLIITGNGSTETRLTAHSFMLFIGSELFEKMLKDCEINSEGMKEIKMPGVRPETLQFILKYLYTDFDDLQNEDVADILCASSKFKLHHIMTICISKLKEQLSAENALQVFEASTELGVDELVLLSQQFILKNAFYVFQQPQFLKLSEASLCKLLELDELEVDEIFLFNTVLSWGESKCESCNLEESGENLHFVLKNIIPLIRFTLMSMQDFSTVVLPSKILDDKETIDVYRYLGMKISNTANQAEPPKWILYTTERKIHGKTMNFTTNELNPNIPTPFRKISVTQTKPKFTKKEKLLKYLRGISGLKTISGLFVSSSGTASQMVLNLQKKATVLPGIVGIPMPSNTASGTEWNSFIDEVISHWSNQHLVRISWKNLGNPLNRLDHFTDTKNAGDVEKRWKDLIEDGGHLNKIWKKYLDTIALHLQKIQWAGVIPIFDILPLINHKLYIWRGRPGKNGTMKLYQMTHDYLTKQHKLHSLIWAWSVHPDNLTLVQEFWPGNDYVDVASVYMFGRKELPDCDYQKIINVVGKKPLAMEEMHCVPTTELLSAQPRWTWFMIKDVKLNDESCNDKEEIKAVFNAESVLNRANIAFFNDSLLGQSAKKSS